MIYTERVTDAMNENEGEIGYKHETYFHIG